MLLEPLRIGDIAIEKVDVRALSDADIEAANAYANILRAEAEPNDPPIPLEQTRARLRNIPDFVVVEQFYARDPDRSIAASAQATWTTTEDNKHLVEASISVRPDRRRRGLAKAMLGLIADVTEQAQRSLLVFGTSESVAAGEIFARRIGAEPGLSQHINRLLISDVDQALIDRWIDEGPGRAPGYSLISIDDAYPDDLVEQIVDVHRIMNTAPRDDLDVEDFDMTVEQMRDWERSMMAAGEERWSYFVRHDADGKLVGFTEMAYNPSMPKVVWQMGTGVHPDHRGHALGKWLKAAMLRRVIDERPAVTEVRTGNADSNDAMLGINTQLGFKPYKASTIWQIRLEALRAYVSS